MSSLPYASNETMIREQIASSIGDDEAKLWETMCKNMVRDDMEYETNLKNANKLLEGWDDEFRVVDVDVEGDESIWAWVHKNDFVS